MFGLVGLRTYMDEQLTEIQETTTLASTTASVGVQTIRMPQSCSSQKTITNKILILLLASIISRAGLCEYAHHRYLFSQLAKLALDQLKQSLQLVD